MAEQAQLIDLTQARVRRSARASEPWVSKAEICRHLGKSHDTVERWMKRGLPYRKRFEHSFPMFQVSAVDEWLEARA